jgi:periplasmic protein CpxP/Spy
MKTSLTFTDRMRRAVLGGSIATLSLFSMAYAYAMPPHGGGHSGNMHHDATKHVDRIAKLVGASAEQKSKLNAIAQAAQTDLKSLHEQAKAGRKQGMTLMSASKIDRDAIEQHRQQQAQIMEKISKRMTQAMADSAEVLTPEQRSKFAERMQSHEGRHGGGMRDRMHGKPATPAQ